jgi:hypothetical protein
MKLTAGQIYDAVTGLNEIANNRRVVPQLANFHLARIHDALEPSYTALEKERNGIVMALGSEKFSDPEKTKPIGWGLTDTEPNFKLYVEQWLEIRAREMDVNVKPITLFALGNDPKGVQLSEFKLLGPLVSGPSEQGPEM